MILSDKLSYLDELCVNCGLTFGSHHAGSSPWPYNYCPGHEDRMDWENGPGTTFKGSGIHMKIERNKPAINGGH